MLAAQHHKLVAQHQDLDLLGLRRPEGERDQLEAALERAGLTHEIVTYPGANHAFFNDTGPRYNPDAAAQAYAKLLDWFGRHLR